jgi:beta-aspartyl-peptidase (threonine type)
MVNYGIVIHGGAGTVSKIKMTKWKAEAYRQVLTRAYTVGFMVLQKGGSAIEAVKQAVVILEDSPLFNAGKGSVFNHYGQIDMDAAIMSGKGLQAGAVAGVPNVKKPIVLADEIMRKSKHVLLSGERALEYAKERGLNIQEQAYFEEEDRYKQYQRALKKDKVLLDHDEQGNTKFGTVGAVAFDKKQNLAAATSTGGMVNKKFGRIGDSPLIGTGTYANNETCAISCTGHGEFYIRAVVAHEISTRMKYGKQSLEQASNEVINQMLPNMGGRGGLIGIDYEGNVVLPFNTKGMYRGFKRANGEEFVGIFRDN